MQLNGVNRVYKDGHDCDISCRAYERVRTDISPNEILIFQDHIIQIICELASDN